MEYVSTRNDNETYTSEQVLNLGLAPDGGLFVPKEFPKFTHEEILSLKNKDFKSIAFIPCTEHQRTKRTIKLLA